MQILQKNHHLWKYLSCHSTWGKYIYSTQSTHFSVSSILGILKILRVVPSSSSSSLLSSFDDSAKLFYYRDGPGYCSSWGISSLTTILDGILFPQPLFLLTFSTLFCCNKVWMPRPLKYLCSLGKLFSGIPQSFFMIQWVIVNVKRIKVKVK